MLLRFDQERYLSSAAPRLLSASAELLLDALPPLQPQMRFLEVGAGAGVLARPLMERIAGLGRLVTVEGDWGLAQHLPQARGRASRALALTDHLPFANASFDVALANLVFGDPRADAPRFAELRRVLRPQGWLLLTVVLRGSFAGVLEALTDACETEQEHATRSAFDELERDLPDDRGVERALRNAGMPVVQLGVEERALFFTDGGSCLDDPLVRDVLLPSWLRGATPPSSAAMARAAGLIDEASVGRRAACPLRTAVVIARAERPR